MRLMVERDFAFQKYLGFYTIVEVTLPRKKSLGHRSVVHGVDITRTKKPVLHEHQKSWTI